MSERTMVGNNSHSQADGRVTVSVVVLSYNSQETIRACLNSLAAQETTVPFEVIVVDSSRDATATIIANEYPCVPVVLLPRRAFLGETRNIGVQHAKGNIIAFLASDCIADPHLLQTRLELHECQYMTGKSSLDMANSLQICLSGRNIYHLGMLRPEDRIARRRRYETLDPGARWQPGLGYAYLTDTRGLQLERLPYGREYFDDITTGRDASS